MIAESHNAAKQAGNAEDCTSGARSSLRWWRLGRFFNKDAHRGPAAADGRVSATIRVVARVIHTDEELLIAKTVCRVLGLS